MPKVPPFEAKIPFITSRMAAKFAARIMPLVRLRQDGKGKLCEAALPDGVLYVPPLGYDLKSSYLDAALTGQPTPAPIANLVEYMRITTYHVHHGEFKPTATEVLAQIYKADANDTIAFEVIRASRQPVERDRGETFYVATTILFKHKLT